MSEENWWMDDPTTDYSQANEKLFKNRLVAQNSANAALQRQHSEFAYHPPSSTAELVPRTSPIRLVPSVSAAAPEAALKKRLVVFGIPEDDTPASSASQLSPHPNTTKAAPRASELSLRNSTGPQLVKATDPPRSEQLQWADDHQQQQSMAVLKQKDVSLRPGESLDVICALFGASKEGDHNFPFAIPNELPPQTQMIFDRLFPELERRDAKPRSRRIRLKDEDEDNEQKWCGTGAAPVPMLRACDRPVPTLLDPKEQERRALEQLLHAGVAPPHNTPHQPSSHTSGIDHPAAAAGYFDEIGRQLMKPVMTTAQRLESIALTVESGQQLAHSLLFPPPRVLEVRQQQKQVATSVAPQPLSHAQDAQQSSSVFSTAAQSLGTPRPAMLSATLPLVQHTESTHQPVTQSPELAAQPAPSLPTRHAEQPPPTEQQFVVTQSQLEAMLQGMLHKILQQHHNPMPPPLPPPPASDGQRLEQKQPGEHAAALSTAITVNSSSAPPNPSSASYEPLLAIASSVSNSKNGFDDATVEYQLNRSDGIKELEHSDGARVGEGATRAPLQTTENEMLVAEHESKRAAAVERLKNGYQPAVAAPVTKHDSTPNEALIDQRRREALERLARNQYDRHRGSNLPAEQYVNGTMPSPSPRAPQAYLY